MTLTSIDRLWEALGLHPCAKTDDDTRLALELQATTSTHLQHTRVMRSHSAHPPLECISLVASTCRLRRMRISYLHTTPPPPPPPPPTLYGCVVRPNNKKYPLQFFNPKD